MNKINEITEYELIGGYAVDGKPLTKNQYNHRLANAEKQLKDGEVISQDDLEKESASW